MLCQGQKIQPRLARGRDHWLEGKSCSSHFSSLWGCPVPGVLCISASFIHRLPFSAYLHVAPQSKYLTELSRVSESQVYFRKILIGSAGVQLAVTRGGWVPLTHHPSTPPHGITSSLALTFINYCTFLLPLSSQSL